MTAFTDELHALLDTRKTQTLRMIVATASLSRDFMLHSVLSFFSIEEVERVIAFQEEKAKEDTNIHYAYAIEKFAEAGCKVSVFLKNGTRTHSGLLIEAFNDHRFITFDGDTIPAEELARVQKELKLP